MKISKTVHVVGGYAEYEQMFIKHGWTVVDCIEDADLVQFCGGEDVWPGYYGQTPHKKTHFNLERDRYERKIYELAVTHGCAVVGVCRGAQFVHVMNGGSLYQHVNNHTLGLSQSVHKVYLLTQDKRFDEFAEGFHVTSTHHQAMCNSVGEQILGCWLSSVKEESEGIYTKDHSADWWDAECVWHPASRSLCYQPHPEFLLPRHACQRFYFKAIKHLLFPKEMAEQMKEAS